MEISKGEVGELEHSFSWDGYRSFHTTCRCGCEQAYVSVEYLEEGEVLTLYYKTSWRDNDFDDNLAQRLWHRVKAAAKVLTSGYLQTDSSFIFRGEEHAIALGRTIIAAGEELKNLQKNMVAD